MKIGEVLRESSRICKVEHKEEMAGATEEKATLEQFHQQMRHVLLEVARKLVRDRMVTGI